MSLFFVFFLENSGCFFFLSRCHTKEGRARSHAPVLLLVWKRLRTLRTFLRDAAQLWQSDISWNQWKVYNSCNLFALRLKECMAAVCSFSGSGYRRSSNKVWSGVLGKTWSFNIFCALVDTCFVTAYVGGYRVQSLSLPSPKGQSPKWWQPLELDSTR